MQQIAPGNSGWFHDIEIVGKTNDDRLAHVMRSGEGNIRLYNKTPALNKILRNRKGFRRILMESLLEHEFPQRGEESL